VVKCAKCDEVLYTDHDIVEPHEVLEAVGGKCPRCGRTLSLMPERVEVMPRFPPPKPSVLQEKPQEDEKRRISKFLRQII
jgi:hypothetical protein